MDKFDLLKQESASSRWTTLTFLVQICPKRNYKLEIHKTNVGIRTSIFEIPCVQIFRQNSQLWIFGPKFAQKGNEMKFEIQKANVEIRISIIEILWVPILRQNEQLWIFGLGLGLGLCVPIFRQNGQLWIFGPKFAQKWILGSEFQKSKSGFGISTSNIPCVRQFSVKMNNF